MSPHDQLFARFIAGLFVLLVLYGGGMTAVVLAGDAVLGSKMVGAFTAMFSGVLGLGSGYLLGSRSHA